MKAVRYLAMGAAVSLAAIAPSALAQSQNPFTISDPMPTYEGVPEPYRVVTEHEMEIGGERIPYQAIAGETQLYDLAGNVTASIFSFSYIRSDIDDPNRPVLFVFNGGPGSASLWIHMGAIGPKQVILDKEVNPSNVPPFGIKSNGDSILDIADLVFIDPVGTGFSKALNGTDPRDFWGVDEDADSVAQFIELWLSEYGRWNSPKYVLGESYGTIRASVLPSALMGSPFNPGVMRGITLDGIILLGTTLSARPGEMPDEETAEAKAARLSLALPGLAATSAYHGLSRGSMDAETAFTQSLAYAKGPYRDALIKLEKDELSEEERAAVTEELTGYIGLPAELIGDDLYLSENEYAKMVLARQGLEIGKYDSRYTLPLANSGYDPVADDPAMGRYVPGFIASFNQMIRDDLHVDVKRPYTAIRWKDLLPSWNWERNFPTRKPKSPAEELAWALRRNQDLRVFVASGYFDLVTTPANAMAQIEAGGVPLDRVRFEEYESGHMLYLGGTSEAFSNDLREFISAGR
ncbi:S10 family peptidase [Ponticaulis profundi]|uniref:S10 family peptidase n=1 Tax=Ponticaulis profundi TaxID=2665222 RepID=A0ABW1S7H3_9PROT